MKKSESRKQVLVTGGSRGIGRAITEALLRAGYGVTIAARGPAELAQCVRDGAKIGPIRSSILDLTDRAATSAFGASWRGDLFGIVHNAGMWGEEGIADPDTGLYDRIMRLNVDGPRFLTKALASKIVRGGRIVLVSSQLGLYGRGGMGDYAASKHALLGFTRSWAYELGPRAITVNAVCPGWVDTASNLKENKVWAKERGMSVRVLMKELSAPYPLRRFIQPSEVAATVAFLMSEDASGLTGQAIGIGTIV